MKIQDDWGSHLRDSSFTVEEKEFLLSVVKLWNESKISVGSDPDKVFSALKDLSGGDESPEKWAPGASGILLEPGMTVRIRPDAFANTNHVILRGRVMKIVAVRGGAICDTVDDIIPRIVGLRIPAKEFDVKIS